MLFTTRLLLDGFQVKAKDTILTLSTSRQNYEYWGPGDTYDYPVAPVANRAWFFKVVPGPIVHGNMKDPNAWSYTCKNYSTWKGQYRLMSGNLNSAPYFYTTYTGYSGDGTQENITSPDWDRTLVYNMALERLNRKVRGDMDLGVSLAELHSTVRMTRALNDVFNFARGAGRTTGIGSTRDLANGWLQFTYGWKPLLSDVFGIADESIRRVVATLEKVKATARLTLTGQRNLTRYFLGANVPSVAQGTGSQACTIVCTLEVPSSSFDLARWTSLNPVSLAWELIPYSFVVDWFVDVGSYLRNLETALLYKTRFRSGYVSELYAYDGTEVLKQGLYTIPSGKLALLTPLVGVIQGDRRFQRSILTSYPFPRAPTFQVDLSSNRLISAAALLRQLLKK